MSIRIREMSYHKVKLNKILSRVTGKPESQVGYQAPAFIDFIQTPFNPTLIILQIEIDTDRDNFMSAWEAKEYGLIDEVVDDGKPGLVAPTADASTPPKTKVWDQWKVEGSKKARKNLPSEERMLRNGYAIDEGLKVETPPTE